MGMATWDSEKCSLVGLQGTMFGSQTFAKRVNSDAVAGIWIPVAVAGDPHNPAFHPRALGTRLDECLLVQCLPC